MFVFSYQNPLLFSSFKFCESSATVSFSFQKSYCKHILVIVQFHWDPFPSFLLNRVKKLRPVKENKRSAATIGLNQIYLNMLFWFTAIWKRKAKHKLAKWNLNQSLFILYFTDKCNHLFSSVTRSISPWMNAGNVQFRSFKIIIIIMRWLWDLAVDIPRGSPSLKSWFLWREENQRTRRTNLRSKDENQQQTQPTRDTRSGEQTWATVLGVEHSHHCAIPAPPERNRILN